MLRVLCFVLTSCMTNPFPPFVCDPECGGQCCRNVGMIDELPSTDGICDHLHTGKCSIYDTRPMVCRVDDAFASGAFGDLSHAEYMAINYAQCKRLKIIS
jgi:hypothetical protein